MLSRKMFVPAMAACLMSSPLWAAAASTSDSATGAVAGVWVDKDLNFTYMGFTTHYSCDGLRDKVRGVLLDLGADKKTLKITEWGCAYGAGRPEHFPGVRAKFRVVQPATGSTDGKQTSVPAHWKPVDLKLRDAITNDSGECELMEQIRQKVVPLFTTRNVEMQSECIPHQASAVRPSLKLEVLAADVPRHQAAEPQAAR